MGEEFGSFESGSYKKKKGSKKKKKKLIFGSEKEKGKESDKD